jgi:lipid II:glycine glycyltransferase (peptidoglycan interpeptide bridge formation enzyme)
VLEEDGALSAIVAAQERRLGFGRVFWYVPHGPVLDYAAAGAADRLRSVVDGLREAARVARAVAVRLEPRLVAGSAEARLFEEAGLARLGGFLQVGYTRTVALADDEGLLASFDKDTRYSIRRSVERSFGASSISSSRAQMSSMASPRARSTFSRGCM